MAKLIVALDYTNQNDALAMAHKLQYHGIYVKIGLELFTREGPSIIQQLKRLGFYIMLDLKLFDIPNTVRGAVRAACTMGVDIITIHLLGGKSMVTAAVDEAQNSKKTGYNRPLIFGVTVLTSIKEGELPGYSQNIQEFVYYLAEEGSSWGIDGIVCSGHEVTKIKAKHPELLCLTPGIRIHHTGNDDQQRVMTPHEAINAGSDFLVIGRPITQAEQPEKVIQELIKIVQ